jgi:hypothetical protein
MQVWCINESGKAALEKEDIGKFYIGDCYVVLYTYHSGDKREEFYLTYWIGKHSSWVFFSQTSLSLIEYIYMLKM